MIKIVRFLVVQKGLDLVDPQVGEDTDDGLDDFNDSGDDSAPSPQCRPKGCQQFVKQMID